MVFWVEDVDNMKPGRYMSTNAVATAIGLLYEASSVFRDSDTIVLRGDSLGIFDIHYPKHPTRDEATELGQDYFNFEEIRDDDDEADEEVLGEGLRRRIVLCINDVKKNMNDPDSHRTDDLTVPGVRHKG